MSQKIKCLNFKEINKGYLVGFADFYVQKIGIEIYGCSIFKKENGQCWLNFPSRKVEKNDKIIYLPYVRFRNKDHQNAFTKLAIESIKDFCNENVPSVQ